ncbi:MAG: hypothetical protein M0Z68_12790 [Gammaproteobacteria bacterium]|jgi:hypothetical protein|nr:hypothetical protein [Gammaproteobacteria bacterium]
MARNTGKILWDVVVIPLAIAVFTSAAKKAVDYAEEQSGWDLQSVRDAVDRAFDTPPKIS